MGLYDDDDFNKLPPEAQCTFDRDVAPHIDGRLVSLEPVGHNNVREISSCWVLLADEQDDDHSVTRDGIYFDYCDAAERWIRYDGTFDDICAAHDLATQKKEEGYRCHGTRQRTASSSAHVRVSTG